MVCARFSRDGAVILKTFTERESWIYPSSSDSSSGQLHLCQGKTWKSPRTSQSPWMPCSSNGHSSQQGDLTLTIFFPTLGKTRCESYSWHRRDYLFQALHIPGGTKKARKPGQQPLRDEPASSPWCNCWQGQPTQEQHRMPCSCMVVILWVYLREREEKKIGIIEGRVW